jgi:hypothetical protein
LSAARGESIFSNGMTGAKSKDPGTAYTAMLRQGVRTRCLGRTRTTHPATRVARDGVLSSGRHLSLNTFSSSFPLAWFCSALLARH